MSVRITYAMNVLNGEPFLKYQLNSIYKHADEIVIVEGAYQKFAHAANPDGHSKDLTVETIKNFPDPERKIKLIQENYLFHDRLEMCNHFFKACTGDVLWQIDVDEFYLSETHDEVRRLFENDSHLDRLSFRVEEYYFSINYKASGAVYASGLSDVRRVFRLRAGEIWGDQRPPFLIGKDGRPAIVRKEIFADEMFTKGHVIHHPTVLFESQFKDKFVYYQKMWSSITQDPKWIEQTWESFYNPLNIMGIEPYCSWIELTNAELPKELLDLYTDAKEGRLLSFVIRNNSDIECYLASEEYPKDIKVAKLFNEIIEDFRKNSSITNLKIILSCLKYSWLNRTNPKGIYLQKGLKTVLCTKFIDIKSSLFKKSLF